MINRRKIRAIIVVTIVVSLFGYTLVMYISEPHAASPTVITNKSYLSELTKGNYANGDMGSIFYHTFSLAGNNATYGFSCIIRGNPTLYYKVGPVWGGETMEILVTEINRSSVFPYFGTFLIEPMSSYSVLNVNGTYYSLNGTGQNSHIHNPFSVTMSNNSISGIHNWWFSPVTFTTNLNFSNPNIPYVKSYNVTYNLEVRPVVEYGPYYVIGNPVWISRTFEYPYQGN